MLGAWPLLEASPLELSLGFYSPLDRGLPLGPAVFFRDARVESIKPLNYLPTPLYSQRRVPFVPFFRAALASARRPRTPGGETCEIAANRRSRSPKIGYTLQDASGLRECNIAGSIW